MIAGAVAYNYNGQQNYVYYDGVKYYRGKNGFFNKLFKKKHNKGKFGNHDLINNIWDVPGPLQPQNYWKKALMSENISKLQGPDTDPALFRHNILPSHGGDNINLGDMQCTGFGEDTKCSNFYDYISNNNNNNNNNALNAKISSAEQEMWLANRNDPSVKMEQNLGSSGGPTSDYNSYLNSLIADDRTIDNHNKWVNEMLPWSGTTTMIDDMDEALSNSGVNWVGLRRPQPIAQSSDSLFVTELDSTSFINNPKFNFRG